MLSIIEITNDLAIKIGAEAARLSPSEGFRLAERLIRKSTSKMIADEVAGAANQVNREPRL